MGYARVISGGPLGRYTIEIDYGSSTRTAILAAADAAIAQFFVKLAELQLKIAAAEAREGLFQARVNDARANYIEQSNTPGGNADAWAFQFKLDTAALTKERAANAPFRLMKAALEFDLAQAQKRRAYWEAFNPVETRDAWCTDYTEDGAAGSHVATMDIPGESALILLAPGARAWRAGDGTVSVAAKLARVASSTAALAKVTTQLGDTSTLLATAVAAETALGAALTAARAAYLAEPTAANLNAQTQASSALSAKSVEIARLRQRITQLTARFVAVQQKLAAANALIASSAPNAGDGVLTARELMSPEQAYFNAAILPGWQKDTPTYRWGTITVLDKEAALCSVALFDARSSAQRLPVNRTGTLTGVPITYMECNADAFEAGDRVVVQFIGQDWDQPVVVGFLDNPKPCIDWPDVAVKVRVSGTARTTGGNRPWMIYQADGFCGRGGIVADTISTNPFNYFLTFSLDTPSFVTPQDGATLDVSLPGDQFIGTNTHLANHVPSGSSPGVFIDFLSSYGSQIAVEARSFAFSDATVTNFIRDGDNCIDPITLTAPYFSGQPIGSGVSEAAPATTWLVSPQPITSFLSSLPTVSVTILGYTKVYIVKEVTLNTSGFVWTLTFGKP